MYPFRAGLVDRSRSLINFNSLLQVETIISGLLPAMLLLSTTASLVAPPPQLVVLSHHPGASPGELHHMDRPPLRPADRPSARPPARPPARPASHELRCFLQKRRSCIPGRVGMMRGEGDCGAGARRAGQARSPDTHDAGRWMDRLGGGCFRPLGGAAVANAANNAICETPCRGRVMRGRVRGGGAASGPGALT